MKRTLCLFLALILAVGICFSAPVTITASAAFTLERGTEHTVGAVYIDSTTGVKFKIKDVETKQVEVCGYSNLQQHLVIPATVNISENGGGTLAYSVTAIGASAFYGCKYLTTIEIPNSVTTIDYGAFCDCTALESVTIGDSVTTIGDSAFYICESLTSVTIPDSVTTIGEGAFCDCTALTSVTIPDSVTTIGRYAFQGCTSLASVTIGKGVKEIKDDAFDCCNNLSTVNVPCSWNENPKYTTFANSVTVDIQKHNYELGVCTACKYDCTHENKDENGICTVCYIAEGTCGENVTWVYDSKTTTLTISGSGVMEDYSYDNNPWESYRNEMTNVIISNGVTSIGSFAFYKCTLLASIEIPQSVTTIGSSAFYKCTLLASIEIPQSVTTIGEYAFFGCTALTSVIIPNSVTTIEKDAFYGCSALETVIIPDSVTTIGEYAFGSCTALVTVKLGKGITTMGGYIFRDCVSLKSVTISEGVTTIGKYAFSSCSALTSVIIPDSVTTIGEFAFMNCKGLETIILPDKSTIIGSGAFSGCSSLVSITIPIGVTEISGTAFEGCTSLTSVNAPCSWNEKPLYKFKSGVAVTIQRHTLENNVCITCSSSNKCGASESDNVVWFLDDGVLYISGTGAMADYDANKTPWKDYKTQIKKVVVGDGVTSIGNYAFYGCTALTSVIISGSVTRLGDKAFWNCASLTSVTIPESVTTIGYSAFVDCASLTSINVNENNTVYASIDGVLFNKEKTEIIRCPQNKSGEYSIPESVITIGGSAFSGCEALTSVIIPDSVTRIGGSAFFSCEALTSVIIPDSVTTIGGSAFWGCSELNLVEIPKNVTTIGALAFCNCTSLASVTIPESVTTIGYSAFGDCASLTSINVNENNTAYASIDGVLFNKEKTEIIRCPQNKSGEYSIPESVITIGEYAFSSCSALTSVIIPANITTIGTRAFSYCNALTSVIIPDNVTTIGEYAFSSCSALTSVIIPANITTIGTWAFSYCDALSAVNVPCDWDENTYAFDGGVAIDYRHTYKNGKCIGDGCVMVCSHETITDGVCTVCDGKHCGKTENDKVVWFYDEATTILTISGSGDMANFDSRDMLPPWANYRDSIKKVVISDGVTNIATYAFYNCTALKDITIGKNVATLDYSAFFGCSALESITVDENNASYLSEDGILFSKDKTKIIRYPQGKAGEYSIPKGVKTIGGYAFRDCALLNSVTIPEGVTTIEEFAFFKCTSISTITIPEGVTSVGNAVFVGCEKLETITLPYSLKEIGTYAFDVNADWISEVNVPCSWNDEVFYPYFKDGVLKIPPHEMENSVCKNCGNDCIHPEYKYGTCTTEGCGKFCEHKNSDLYSCEDCGGIECGVDPILDDDDVKAYYESATKTMVFAGSGRMINKTYTNWESIKNEIEKVVIFEGVESIGASAFDSCEKLTSITIPESVTEIGELAFNNCASLTSITVADNNANFSSSEDGILFNKDKSVLICCPAGKEGDCEVPSGVTTIGNNAFSNCVKLQSVTIPVSVITIGEETFAGCEDVKLIVEPGSDAHNYAKTNSIPYIFNGYNEAETAQIEKLTFTEMRNDNSEVIEYSLSFCDKEISGALNIPATYNGKPVTTIGNFVFEDCTALSEITIPKSVTTIGAMAFCRCSSLETITIPKSVTIIGGYAFIGCAKLTSIIVDENNINYSNSEDGVLFDKNKENLICYPAGKTETSYTVPESVTTISEGAFMDCIALTSVTIPESVTTIGVEAFYGCTALETVTIPGIETTIGNNAFSGCNNLSTVNVPCNWNTENPPYAFDENVNVAVADHKEIIYEDNNDGTHTAKYSCCGTVIGEPEKHSFNESEYCEFCEYQCPHEKYSNGVCDVCDCYCSHTNTEPVYKSYEDNTNRHYKYYECCGLEEWAGYHEDENGDTKCDQCKVQLVAKAFLEPWTSQGVRMGDNYFVSLENAVDKVNEIYGEELILLSDATIAEDKTITLESAILNTNGKKLTVNGTLVLPDSEYTGATIPTGVVGSGTVKIGENFFKLADNGKWCCAEESQHTGSVQNCMGYLCELCGNYYGEANDNHDIVIDKAVAPTCTKTGLTEGQHCTRCDDKTVAQEVVPALNHKGTLVQVEAKAKTCTTVGWEAYEYCTACDYTTKVEIPASHEIVKVNAKAKTCTEAGHNAYEYCTECDYTTKVVIPASHELQEVKAKAPTCEAIGWDAYKHCTECDYTTYKEKAKLGHDIIIDKAVAATCTETGLTEGSHCTRCDGATVAQQTIAKKAHTEVTITGKAATCTTTGLTDGKKCSVCGTTTVAQQTIAKKAHTEVTITGKAATCTATGLTDGKKCSVCGTVTVEQQIIAKKAHTEITVKGKAATCTATGLTDGKKCSVCGTTTVAQQTIAKKAHTEVTVTGKAATCTATGLTDGKKCSVCGTVTKAQQTIKATGHKEVVIPAVAPTFTTVGKTEGKKCSVCGTVTVAQKDVAKLTLATPVVTVKNSATGVKVTWGAIDGAEIYKVYRKTYSTKTKKYGSWKTCGTVTTTSYVDTKAKSGTKYIYTVKALNGDVKSGIKSSSSILFLSQPTVKIVNNASGVKVSWNKITGATGYKVYRSVYSGGKWSKWKSVKTISKGSTVSWTDKSVKSGVKYKYTVKAVNGKTGSTYKSSSSLLYLAQPKVAVKALSNGIKVAWVQSAGATSYKIYRSEYNAKTKKWSSWKGIKTAKSTSKSYTDKSAKKGVKYRYTVKAVNGKVASTYKASASVKR